MSDDPFKELRDAADSAAHELSLAVNEACPGPHVLTQYRDGRPAHCDVCGLTARGEKSVSIFERRAAVRGNLDTLIQESGWKP